MDHDRVPPERAHTGPAERLGTGPQTTRPPPTRTRRPPVQFRLEIGSVDDPAEREADLVADRVLRSLRHVGDDAEGPATGASSRIRRFASRVAAGAEGASLAGDEARSGRIRRFASPAALPASGAAGGELDRGSEAQLRRSIPGGRALEAAIRTPMERAFGTDFAAVRIHRSSALAPRFGATAFTHGHDIHFAPGEYQPDRAEGRRLLAHELTHVVQQGSATRRVGRAADVVAHRRGGSEARPIVRVGPRGLVRRVFVKGGELDELVQYMKPPKNFSLPASLDDPEFKGAAWLRGKGIALSNHEYKLLGEGTAAYKTLDDVRAGLRRLRLPASTGMEGMTAARLRQVLPSYGITDATEQDTVVAKFEELVGKEDTRLATVTGLVSLALSYSADQTKALEAAVRANLSGAVPGPAGGAPQLCVFKRGDKRPKNEIHDAGGFFGWGPITIEHARTQAAAFLQKPMKDQKAWFQDWKAETKGKADQPAFVAFGEEAQKGANEYEMRVPLIWAAGNPQMNVILGTDTGTVATATLIAFKHRGETVFLTGIPLRYVVPPGGRWT